MFNAFNKMIRQRSIKVVEIANHIPCLPCPSEFYYRLLDLEPKIILRLIVSR